VPQPKQRENSDDSPRRRSSFWPVALFGGGAVLCLFWVLDAVFARPADRIGIVTEKIYSPELVGTITNLSTDAEDELIVTPVQTTDPASDEIEVEEDCRFAVTPERFQQLRGGDRIRYREYRGILFRGCEGKEN
jgi:hypothetical protein